MRPGEMEGLSLLGQPLMRRKGGPLRQKRVTVLRIRR